MHGVDLYPNMYDREKLHDTVKLIEQYTQDEEVQRPDPRRPRQRALLGRQAQRQSKN